MDLNKHLIYKLKEYMIWFNDILLAKYFSINFIAMISFILTARLIQTEIKNIRIIKSVVKIIRLFLLSKLSSFYEILEMLVLGENSGPIQVTSRRKKGSFNDIAHFRARTRFQFNSFNPETW